MESIEKELLIARILAGYIRFKYNGKTLYITSPNQHQKYISLEIYQAALEEATAFGLYNDEELLNFMVDNDIWDTDKQKMLDGLPSDIETLKVGLYNYGFNRSNDKDTARAGLAIAKEEYNKLYNLRNSYNYLSCSGYATINKLKYIIGVSLRDKQRSVFTENTDVIEKATAFYTANQLSEAQYRELARTEPWRPIWNCKKSEHSVFGKPSVKLTAEQRHLSIWSAIYDSIYEHPETPRESVIEDDDVLDGWMIIQRRKREDSLDKLAGEDVIKNDKIRSSEEIFIPAQSLEDAKRIEKLNDLSGSILKKQRMNYLQQQGTVNEADMPDRKIQIQSQLNRMRAK